MKLYGVDMEMTWMKPMKKVGDVGSSKHRREMREKRHENVELIVHIIPSKLSWLLAQSPLLDLIIDQLWHHTNITNNQ